MIDRNDLVGREKEKNKWGNMVYETGLLEKYFSGEPGYHDLGYEGQLIASLCLYLLSGKEDPSPFVTTEYNTSDHIYISKEDALFFMEHFVFHNISKKEFLDEMAKQPKEEDKVRVICELINSRIRLSKTDDPSPALRFHDVYINCYQSFTRNTTPKQLKLFCNHAMDLFNKNGRKVVSSWEEFEQACEQCGINIKYEPVLDSQNRRINVSDSTDKTKEYSLYVDKLLKMTQEYKNSLPAQHKQVHTVLDELIGLLKGKEKGSIEQYYAVLNRENGAAGGNNLQIITKNTDRSTASFITGLAALTLVLVTGILPGLIAIAAVYALTKKTPMSFFNSYGDSFKANLGQIENEHTSLKPKT